MPRDETYHEVEKRKRHALKPYDRDDNQYESLDERNLSDDNKPVNIFNPSGSRNNCTDLGESYASGLPNEYSPPPPHMSGRDDDDWIPRAKARGFDFSDDPPDNEYHDGPREVSTHYLHENGGGHVVARDGGFNDATYTYSCLQDKVHNDVTKEVNEARRDGRVKQYFTRPNFGDWEREQLQNDDKRGEDSDDGGEGDVDYDAQGDYEMDEEQRAYNAHNAQWYRYR